MSTAWNITKTNISIVKIRNKDKKAKVRRKAKKKEGSEKLWVKDDGKFRPSNCEEKASWEAVSMASWEGAVDCAPER